MTKLAIKELDIFFLSYDEPNADENFAHLLTMFPTAKRIHGVFGFDAVHKEAARQSSGEYFVTIDADTFVFDSLINCEIDEDAAIDLHLLRVRHEITGATTFAIKIWRASAILNLKSHELADKSDVRATLDFGTIPHATHTFKEFGITAPNSSPFHAFRSAFRQSFKCALAMLKPESGTNLHKNMQHINAVTVEQLCSIGLDCRFGLYSILGARLGALHAFANMDDSGSLDPKTVTPDKICDYDFMKEFIDAHLALCQTSEQINSFLSFDWFEKVASTLKVSFRHCTMEECFLYRLLINLPTTQVHIILNHLPWNERKSFYFKDGWWDGMRISVDDLLPLIGVLSDDEKARLHLY